MSQNETPRIGEEFELFENGSDKPIDQVTIIGTIQHLDGRFEIKVTGKIKRETDFCCQENSDSIKWLVIHRDPMTNERCFSPRGPWYSLKPVQKN